MDVISFTPAAKAAPGYVDNVFAGSWDLPDTDNTALQGLKQAHVAAREGWKQIFKTNSNLMRSPNGRDKPLETLQRSASFAQTRIKAVQKQAVLAVEAAQINLDHINTKLGQVLNPPDTTAADVAVMAEIRAHVGRLGDLTTREAFISAALQRGDLRTVRAVVSAPGYLTGTNELTHQRWLDEFYRATAPGLVTCRDQLTEGIELAQAGARAIEQHAREVIDFTKAANLDALAKELEGL